jgi:hypothetical protein
MTIKFATKFATQDPNDANRCILPNGNPVTPANAKALGYTIKSGIDIGADLGHSGEALKVFAKNFDRAIELGTTSAKQTSYMASVLALPEAATRPAAAAKLGASCNEDNVPLAQAQAFLRGLPEETVPVASVSHAVAAAAQADMQLFRRKAELRVSMLAVNASKGNAKAGRDAKKLSLALRIFDETGVTLGEALSVAGLDARATVESILK